MFLPALRENLPLFQHHDVVRIFDGGQPVCDDQQGLALGQGRDALLDLIFIFRVGESGSFVQNDDGGILQQHPGNGDTLLFAAGKSLARFARRGIIALRQLGDELFALGCPGGGLYFFIGGRRAAQPDVFQQGTAEQVVVLRHKADKTGELRQRHIPHIRPADGDAARRHIPEPGNQFCHRGLAAAGRAHQCGEAALRQGQADAEAGVLDAVHDAVARAGQPDAVLPGDGSQEDVVIRGVGVNIERVVVQITHRDFGAHPLDAHALQCRIAHDGVDIVGQGLVKFEIDLIPGYSISPMVMVLSLEKSVTS